MIRQRIDHRHAYAVQAAGNFVGIVIKLSARMQYGHDDFGSGTTLLVHVYWNAATVVRHTDGAIRMNSDDHMVAIACKSFIDGVVDDFEHHVMQTRAIVRIAY